VAARASDAPAPRQRVVVVRGSITDDRTIAIEPTFTLDARPAIGDPNGSYRVSGLAADGRVLFTAGFEPAAIDHAPTVRHFTVAVPATPDIESALTSILVTTPAARATDRVVAADGRLDWRDRRSSPGGRRPDRGLRRERGRPRRARRIGRGSRYVRRRDRHARLRAVWAAHRSLQRRRAYDARRRGRASAALIGAVAHGATGVTWRDAPAILVRRDDRSRPGGGRQRGESGAEGDRPALRLQRVACDDRVQTRRGAARARGGQRVPDAGAVRRGAIEADQARRVSEEPRRGRDQAGGGRHGAPRDQAQDGSRRRNCEEDRRRDQGRQAQEGAGVDSGGSGARDFAVER